MSELYVSSRKEQFGERMFNFLITNIPSHTIRQWWLRYFGATLGTGSSIMMGSTVFGLHRLRIGNNVSIGFSVLLDARGGITIDDDVVIASDVQIITAQHTVDSDDFHVTLGPVHIQHHAWVASRAMVLQNVTIGVGAVVGAASLVRTDVGELEIAAGIPAKARGTRKSTLDYHPTFRPLLY
ncbi:Acetyltransferase (isoleucine patch superfamily) [Rhodococcoides kroppenstedtii]|uniref:Acetyltransferase (Isoleucine patch superfamily) n=1 Tax=Rhodococcoides kroppenstedtii TaxID=293050 RepID=A0A1I0TMW5_9NOCA|nr:acyltransferase [Rhodococcus kroppenstedtii]SFA53085.1 Acetyltransferase (isoleucine patch superfamily) [Rhodococcus kroppenstedtii]